MMMGSNNNGGHLWIEDDLYHHQTVNGINLYNIYGHFIEENIDWEAEDIIDVCV